MYNLMVTAAENAWQEGVYVWHKSRILEGTSDKNKEKFGTLSIEALESMATFPTLFMYESGREGEARVGKIKRVQQRGGEIRIIFEFDDTVPPLSIEQIEKLQWDLEIDGFEYSRTHWAVKDANLYEVLNAAGIKPTKAPTEPVSSAKVEVVSERIFLVHGREEGVLNKVARFLETRVGLKVCVLGEQPNKGRTIITKFQEEAMGATYAVVLMTPDDVGFLKPELAGTKSVPPVPRARQNVIFELGFFLGKLGASRVCVLLGAGVEKPSDYDGVIYIPYDDNDGWKTKLVTELHTANLSVSPDWWKDDKASIPSKQKAAS